jgi:transcriptional regulator GlxA family with amidase domain
MGWRDEPGSEQQILCWVWQKPPSLDFLAPPDGQWLHWCLNEEAISRLLLIHRATRSELSRSDAFSALAIRAKQTELDVELARSIVRQTCPAEARLPGALRMALDWIENNLNSARPVADLCDRLEIGKAQIVRLFKNHFNQTPLEFINAQKVRFATRRLSSGQPVKAVAIDLGYLHVHDFSRFYRSQTGQRPSSVGR